MTCTASSAQDQTWAEVRGLLSDMMFGFNNLTETIQGMMVGNSLATGELYETHDMATTRKVVADVFANFVDMTTAFGFES